MSVRMVGGLLAVMSTWLLALACGSRSELDGFDMPSRGSGSQAGHGGQGGQGGAPRPPGCVVFDSNAVLAPLDVILLMDSSGSMVAPTPGSGQKWWAVRNALESFFLDPATAGVGVSITFFPIVDETVAESCLSDADCGEPEMCSQLRRCLPEGLNTCITDDDCKKEGSTCEPVGICENAPTTAVTYCYPSKGYLCQPTQGPCIPFGGCDNRYTCDAGSYTTPVVPLAPMPAAAPAVLSAIEQQDKEGGTPTLPALDGGVAQGVARIGAEPDHKVIVLLATDGLPTVCDTALDSAAPTQAIAHLASVAADGLSHGVQTFVIGVFAYDETDNAQSNLDAIALAGGSGAAFVISSSTTTAQQILDALRQVRQSTSCEFPFALDGGAKAVDYDAVWVRITTSSGEVWVEHVDGVEDCDPTYGGFYYDIPPEQGTPSRLALCPASCEVLGSSQERSIEIFSTCNDPLAD